MNPLVRNSRLIPALPGGDTLFLLAAGVVAIALGLVLFLLLRRLWILHRGRAEEAAAERIESMLLGWLHGEIGPEILSRAFSRSNRVQLLGLITAVSRVEKAGRLDLRERMIEADLPRHLLAALDPKHDRWTRAAAARAIGALAYFEGMPALVAAMADPDPAVSFTSASALAALGTLDAAQALLDRVGRDSPLNNARLVSLVERMPCDTKSLLPSMLHRGDPVAIFWGLGLVAQMKAFEFIDEIRPFLESPDANVRAAAAECVGHLRIPLTDRWLGPLLADTAWFVKCHAAKALGQMKAIWAVEEIVPLLEDKEWWCRHNGADALVLLGTESIPALERFLEHSEDRFARNSAVEALERIGWFEPTLEAAGNGSRRAEALLRVAALNGGVGFVENALTTTRGTTLEAVFRILLEAGDLSSAGRIKRAIHQKLFLDSADEALVVRAREVAAALGRP